MPQYLKINKEMMMMIVECVCQYIRKIMRLSDFQTDNLIVPYQIYSLSVVHLLGWVCINTVGAGNLMCCQN